jgi:hypothetical protein
MRVTDGKPTTSLPPTAADAFSFASLRRNKSVFDWFGCRSGCASRRSLGVRVQTANGHLQSRRAGVCYKQRVGHR